MEKEQKCPICGEPTVVYYGRANKNGLCMKHARQANAGEIIQCPNCGKWNDKNVVCDCKKKEETKSSWVKIESPWTKKKQTTEEKTKELLIKQNEIIEENKTNDELTCIICGEPSNGKHFCYKCWNKYKDHAIDIRITNCKETQILDNYGNKKITCHDGRKVRSRAEKIINDFFFDNRIRVVYEKEIPYTENDETIILHPDFYLPDYENGLFIEYNELSNPKYKKSKEYTQKIYNNLGFSILVLTDEDIDNDLLNLKIRLKITI